MSQELSEKAGALQATGREATYPPFRRRHFLIDRRYQLKAGLLNALAVMLLLVFINLVWYAISVKTISGLTVQAPELAQQLASQHRTLYYTILLVACAALVGVILVSILETHRTAGAAYNLEQRLREVEQGRLDIRVTLRKNDNLKPLGAALERTCNALQQRARSEAETLDRLADEIRRINDPGGARQIATRLAQLADEKRQATLERS
jgi:methyl-accepting chemotaxis protein